MIYTHTSENIKRIIEKGKGFTVFLDDTAQIIGSEVKLVSEKNIEASLEENSAVLVKEGYAASFGRSTREAETAMEVLEKACFVLLKGESLGGVIPLSEEDSVLMRNNYLNNYSKAEEGDEKAVTGRSTEGTDSRELSLRKDLVAYGNKLVEEGLVSGTWGNLSIRLDEDTMVVTPSGITYDRLTPGDMVKVRIDDLTWDGDLKPTSEKILHAEIYRRRPEVRAIIHTHQTGASIFAACEKDLGEIKTAAYALPGTDDLAKFTADALGENPTCIMAHHGMCAVGKTLAEALENCTNLETLAMKQCGRGIPE